MVQWYKLDGDAALAKNRAGLVEQYEKTKHILVEDVSLATVVLGTTAAVTKQEPIDVDVPFGAAATKQEPKVIADATNVLIDADAALDAAVALEDMDMAMEPTHGGLEEAKKGLEAVENK
jgi:hypothetical protein